MTAQSLDITVSNPEVTVNQAQYNTVAISANNATVVVSESLNQLVVSPAVTKTVDVYDPTQGLKFTTNPNNPFLSTTTCDATIDSVVSVAGFCVITLRWATTGNCAYVNVYRGMSDNFSHAAKVGDSDESAFTDAVEPGVTYFYWFEPVGYNSTTGTVSQPYSATSGVNVTGFIQALGDLTAAHLSPTLTSLVNQLIGDTADAQKAKHDGAITDQVIYINSQYGKLLNFVNQYKAEMNTADSNSLAQLESQSLYFATQTTALAQQISSLSTTVVTDIAKANAAITQEQTTRADEIEAVAARVTTLNSSLSTDISTANALINSEAGTRANAVEAVAGQVNQLKTDFQKDFTSTKSLVTQEESVRSAENLALAKTITQLIASLATTENSVNASLSNQDSTLATLNSAVASTQQSLKANYDTLSAGITSEARARASATSALSGTITSHTTQLGNMSTTVSETAQSVDGIEGEYGVKIDANGRVIGFGLINGPGVAAFDIVADNFSIANPDSPTVKDLYYDSAANTLKFRGQLILSNGANSSYTVSDLSDIQAQDGTHGDTIYTEFQYSADGTNWHDQVAAGDTYIRTRTVTNGVAGNWGTATNLKGDAGYTPVKGTDYYDGTGRYISYIFKTGTSAPSAPTTGSFNGSSETVPTDWQDDPYVESGKITYVSKRTYIQQLSGGVAGSTWNGSAWATPSKFFERGTNGTNGVSYTGTTEYYKLTSGNTAPARYSSGTAIASGWGTSPSSPTATNKYLWNFSRSTRSNSTFDDSGVSLITQYVTDGDPGRGISGITEKYQLGTSASTAPTGTWHTSVSDAGSISASNPYLWNKTTITYTDTTTSVVSTLIAAKGNKGDEGDTPVKGADYFDGTGRYVSYVFKTGTSAPSVPTTGSYNGTAETVPSGWSDDPVYTAGNITWVSKATYVQQLDSNGGASTTWNRSSWSTPTKFYEKGDSGADSTVPGPPGSDSTVPGPAGNSGAGFYRYGSTTGVWPNTATANSYLLAAAGRAVSQDDVLTIYKSSDLLVSSTRRYTGSTWVTAGLILHGDMIATGTIAVSKLAATAISAISADLGNITAGTLQDTPVNPKFKIDLATGTITIRDNNNNVRVKIGNLS